MEAAKDMAQAMDVSLFSFFHLLFIYLCSKSEHVTNLSCLIDGGGNRGYSSGGYGSGRGGGLDYGGRDRMSNLGNKLDNNIQWDMSTLPPFEKNFYIVHLFYFCSDGVLG